MRPRTASAALLLLVGCAAVVRSTATPPSVSTRVVQPVTGAGGEVRGLTVDLALRNHTIVGYEVDRFDFVLVAWPERAEGSVALAGKLPAMAPGQPMQIYVPLDSAPAVAAAIASGAPYFLSGALVFKDSAGTAVGVGGEGRLAQGVPVAAVGGVR